MILLDHRVDDQIATRRLRIVKYRGSTHGTNEYPFLIDEHGLRGPADHVARARATTSSERVRLDRRRQARRDARRQGLSSAAAACWSRARPGTGKTSLAAHFADAACRRGERCLYFAFEESPGQIMRNMRSIGIDLRNWVEQGLLRFHATRPTQCRPGDASQPDAEARSTTSSRSVVVVDPISSFDAAGTPLEAQAMLMRLIDLLKARSITAMFTSLTTARSTEQATRRRLVPDRHLDPAAQPGAGRRAQRAASTCSRRAAWRHSNQIREFLLTDRGADLQDVYVGPDGVLVGSARAAQEMQDRASAAASRRDVERRKGQLERKHKEFKARLAELEAAYAAEALDLKEAIVQEEGRLQGVLVGRTALASDRQRTAKGGRR